MHSMPLAMFHLKSFIVIWMSSRNGDQVGQTDKLNSKTERQTKFGTAGLLWHIQSHSTIKSGRTHSDLIANNYIVHLNPLAAVYGLFLTLQSIIDHIVVISQEWYGKLLKDMLN